jgi:hypothetical protein
MYMNPVPVSLPEKERVLKIMYLIAARIGMGEQLYIHCQKLDGKNGGGIQSQELIWMKWSR